MAEVPGVTLIKTFTYRDQPDEEWSNTYWFTGGQPTSSAAWETLFNQLIALERNVFASTSSVTRALGYAKSDEHWPADHIVDYPIGSQPGSLTDAAGRPYAGDQAGLVRWNTGTKNKRGKWIYLRKYMHDGFESTADRDRVSPGTLTAYTTFAEQLHGGLFLGGRRIASPSTGLAPIDGAASEWVTTRTLKRRGKRPLVP